MNQTRLRNLDLELHKEYKTLFERITMQFGQCSALLLLLFGVITLGILSAAESAYAGPSMIDVWAFYGEIGGGTVDAKAGGGLSDVVGPPAVFGISSVNNVGPDETYQNVLEANGGMTAPKIEVTCWNNAPNPAGDGSVTFNFNTAVTGVLPAENCIQNQRNNNDIGLGVEPPVGISNPNELERDELLVFDLTELVDGDYDSFMYVISSNTGGDEAHLWASDNGPSGIGDVVSISLTAGESLGVDQLTDVYQNFPTKKFLYVKEVGTSDSGDLLLQQIKAEVDVIGGTGISTDETPLLLAGAQTNAYWIIPIVVSVIVIGIITVRRQ